MQARLLLPRLRGPAAFGRPGRLRPAPLAARHGAACPSTSWARACGSEAAAVGGHRQRWDITPEKWVDIRFEEEDIQRFSDERKVFRAEPRLLSEALSTPVPAETMDLQMAVRGAISSFRLGDCYAEFFHEVVLNRITEAPELTDLFQIPAVEDKSIQQPMHSKAVPGAGTYLRVRMQTYWLALHIWLLHTKQHALQEKEGLFGSALCTLLTRRIFEFQWDRIRMLLHAADVPIMSITNELQDLQEFVFGFCVALDDVYREEAGVDAGAAKPGTTLRALELHDKDLGTGQFGLAPRLKYILWANVYSGAVPHDAKELHELTVYLLRQRIAMEALDRNNFLSCSFNWADHPLRSMEVSERS